MTDLTQAFPELFEPFDDAKQNGWRFVHYTTAPSALRIIESKKIGMRNAEFMNDSREIRAGLEKIADFFNLKSPSASPLWTALDRIQIGLSEKTGTIFDGWMSDLESNTFILSLSLHDPLADDDGRLSMWRAYSGDLGVALVIKGDHLWETSADLRVHGPCDLRDRY
jgi:hypothetical protein